MLFKLNDGTSFYMQFTLVCCLADINLWIPVKYGM